MDRSPNDVPASFQTEDAPGAGTAAPGAGTAAAARRESSASAYDGHQQRRGAPLAGLNNAIGNVAGNVVDGFRDVAGNIRSVAVATGATAQKAVAIGQQISRQVIDIALLEEPEDPMNGFAMDLDGAFSSARGIDDRKDRRSRQRSGPDSRGALDMRGARYQDLDDAHERRGSSSGGRVMPRPTASSGGRRSGDFRRLPNNSLSPVPPGHRRATSAGSDGSARLPGEEDPDLAPESSEMDSEFANGAGMSHVSHHGSTSGHDRGASSAQVGSMPPTGTGGNHAGATVGRPGGYRADHEEDDDEELMIGEVRTIRIKREMKALWLFLRHSLILVIPSLLVHLLNILGAVDSNYRIADVSVLWWSLFAAAALLSLPFLRFGCRFFAYSAMRYGSKLLYRSNALYFTVALHYDVSFVAWAAFLVVGWRHILLKYIDMEGGRLSTTASVVDHTLKCHLALRVGWLVRNFLVLLVATKYLWRPYLERVQSNIFAQYALLMLTDFVTCGYLDRDDERFALQISNPRMKWEKLSLYAVSKAIGFVPRHKLGRQYSKTLLDSRATEAESAAEAQVLGNFLFDQLALIACNRHPTIVRRGSLEETLSRLPSRLDKEGSTYNTLANDEEGTTPATTPPPGPSKESFKTAKEGGGRKSPSIGGRNTAEDKEEQAEVLRQITYLDRDNFCPIMHPTLATKAFAMFDMDGNGTTTREEMVQGVVQTFRDHKSLALTLRDSQHIAVKLGQLTGFLILFCMMFIWLRLWGYDVMSLTLTFASFLVAIAFMIGNAASNLVISIVYVFVQRVFDVGDRVLVYDDKGVLCNCVVTKINLLLTEFKRWDETILYIPNTVLSTRVSTNIQRSGHQWHEFFIHCQASIPNSKLTQLREFLTSFAKENDTPAGLYSYIVFALVGIEDSTKLTVRIAFRQKSNFQELPRYWATHSMCTQAIKEGCDAAGVTYIFPELPMSLKQKLP